MNTHRVSVSRPLGLVVAGAALLVLASMSVAFADETQPAQQDSLMSAVATTSPNASSQTSGGVQISSLSHVLSDAVDFQYFNPRDARSVGRFETPKVEGAPFTGSRVALGAAFAQQFQNLAHQNSADPKMVTVGTTQVNANQLIGIGSGFNNAVANLYLDAQIARGIRVQMTSYLSSRHHQESWVKDGYLLVDASPIDQPLLNNIMKYTTLQVGHFEINYGDAHFRRTDNGNGMFNPFVGNLLMDAFTTEIGAQAYLRANGFLAMAGVTGGEVHGQVTQPGQRSPTYLAKVGFDRQLAEKARVRLTGSMYTKDKSVNNTLYSGSRAGSRYYDVLENTQSTESAQAWSGDVQPGLRSKVTAWVINPFVRVHGLELFGNIEQAKGRAATEITERTWNQYSGEALYRLFDDQFYVGGRYNIVKGTFATIANEVSVDRSQFTAGWYVTPKVLAKLEYVKQNYYDFPTTDIRSGGRFEGLMVEGVVTF